MNKKISLGLTITLVALVAGLTFILTSSFNFEIFNRSIQNVKEREAIYSKLDVIGNQIRSNYIGDVDDQKLSDALSEGYIKILNDPYARYLSPEENVREKNADNGIRVGIGVTVSADQSGYIFVEEVSADSSASEAGIKYGDLIVKINGQSVTTIGYDEAIKKISGEAGTKIDLTFRSSNKDKKVTLTRRQLEIVSVETKIIDDIGYMKINTFNNQTKDDFLADLSMLQQKKVKGIVFDLRNNTGGLLDPTIKMIDSLVPEGTIATATYKDDNTKVIGESDKEQVDLPMAVIINKNTASASELFASALHDFGKAVLVGEQSYGKGVMQTTHELTDGSAIVFTTAKFQTSKTENFNKVGLKPDYEVDMKSYSNSYLKTLNKETDVQLSKAIEVLIPDVNEITIKKDDDNSKKDESKTDSSDVSKTDESTSSED